MQINFELNWKTMAALGFAAIAIIWAVKVKKFQNN